jgi:hypothetical protein
MDGEEEFKLKKDGLTIRQERDGCERDDDVEETEKGKRAASIPNSLGRAQKNDDYILNAF